ncbi:MAG: FHA domain-containing protein [Candidatus Aminicenantes bacterium]|nr:FHA domain-containing protein [Candidatus Aminicenantes bacterium]
MATLFVYPKQGEPSTLTIDQEAITIGRAADNTIVLTDPFCSSRHAVIYRTAAGFAVRDNGSKNGTYLNGRRLTAPADLARGDEIAVGSARFLFDRPITAAVEVTDHVAATTNINTIIPSREILSRPTTGLRKAAQAETEALRSERQLFSVLNEVSSALLLHKPLQELLEHILDLLGQHLPMDRGVLLLGEGKPPKLVPRVIRVNDPQLLNRTINLSRGILDMAYGEQLSVLTSDAALDPRFRMRDSIIDAGIHSVMCVPLWTNKDIIGVFYADRIVRREPFTDDDLRLLTLLANLAAVKIENALLVEQALEKERMERELRLAADIQADFLPKKPPPCDVFEIAGKNIPCHQVGGDYYDFLPIDDSRTGVVVADVSGKGVSASLLMASLRAALHSEVSPGHALTAMVGRLNAFVYKSSAPNAFITFFYAELDKDKGELRYVNAGHNPPLHLRRDGSVGWLEGTGLCLGMLEGSAYELKAESLEPGDLVVLYTDGITESRNSEGEEYGLDRLVDYARGQADAPAEDVCVKLLEDLAAFTGPVEPADDRTLVIVRRL